MCCFSSFVICFYLFIESFFTERVSAAEKGAQRCLLLLPAWLAVGTADASRSARSASEKEEKDGALCLGPGVGLCLLMDWWIVWVGLGELGDGIMGV